MSENVVAVRSIEIVTAEITMIRDNARKVFLESVIQIGTRLEEAKQMVPSGEWTAYLTDKLGYKPSTAQNYICGKSTESSVFGKKGGRAAAQSAAERIYCEQEQRRRQPDADAVSQELHGLAQDQRSEQEGTAARAERRLAAQARL